MATHPLAKELDELLTQAVRGGLPGALMALAEGDSTWYGAAGVPDLAEPERPLQVCHLMPIKSVTKSFVAVRAMQLVEDGQLELDDTLQTLLSKSELEGLPNTERITLRQLLEHTSGIRHYPETISYVADYLNEPSDTHSVAEAIAAIRGEDAYFEPGAGYHYSNTNYLLLQQIIERLTGRRLVKELRDSIWTPLQLEHTHFHQGQPLSDHVPRGYMDLYGNGDAHQIDYLNLVASGEGGIESTLLDLVRFSRGLFEQQTLVSAATLNQMTSMVNVDEAEWGYTGTGLGLKRWATQLGVVFGHTGEDLGYKAYWHYAPKRKLTWVLLLNSNYGQFEQRAEHLREAVFELLARD